jgi:hypothetical protein
MAAYDFPPTAGEPTDGSFTYTAPTGVEYEWNGYSWTLGAPGPGKYVRKSGDTMTGELIVPSLSSPSGNLPIERASIADSQVQSFGFQDDTANWYPLDPIPTWCNHIRYDISLAMNTATVTSSGFYLRWGTAAGPLLFNEVSAAGNNSTVIDNAGNLLYTGDPFAIFASTLEQRFTNYVVDFYIYNRGIGGGSDFYCYGVGSGVYATPPPRQAQVTSHRMYVQHITPQAPFTVMPDRMGCIMYGGTVSASMNKAQIKQTFLTDGPVGAVADLGPVPTPIVQV